MRMRMVRQGHTFTPARFVSKYIFEESFAKRIYDDRSVYKFNEYVIKGFVITMYVFRLRFTFSVYISIFKLCD